MVTKRSVTELRTQLLARSKKDGFSIGGSL